MKKLLIYIDIAEGKIDRTIELDTLKINSKTMINLDVDKENNLIGIEILGPSKLHFVDWKKALKVKPKKRKCTCVIDDPLCKYCRKKQKNVKQ